MSVNALDRLIYGAVENRKRLLGQNSPFGPTLTQTKILLYFPRPEILHLSILCQVEYQLYFLLIV